VFACRGHCHRPRCFLKGSERPLALNPHVRWTRLLDVGWLWIEPTQVADAVGFVYAARRGLSRRWRDFGGWSKRHCQPMPMRRTSYRHPILCARPMRLSLSACRPRPAASAVLPTGFPERNCRHDNHAPWKGKTGRGWTTSILLLVPSSSRGPRSTWPRRVMG